MKDEFTLINHFFSDIGHHQPEIALGIGDDCALIRPTSETLAISIDTLVEGVHFPVGMNAEAVGFRALAVSLSDLAAMAARPSWFTLSLTLPESNEVWLTAFSHGLRSLAESVGVSLIGGDTTRGPLAITLQVAGYGNEACLSRRSGAQPGDVVLVSGDLGGASAGLELLSGRGKPDSLDSDASEALCKKFCYPVPRFDLRDILAAHSTASIDISDGLLADLSHILKASGVGATLDLDAIPVSDHTNQFWGESALEKAVSFGDDYELCACFPESFWETYQSDLSGWYKVGQITKVPGLKLTGKQAEKFSPTKCGYQHF